MLANLCSLCLQREEVERLAAEAAEKLALEQAATDPNVWAMRGLVQGEPWLLGAQSSWLKSSWDVVSAQAFCGDVSAAERI
jgi:hypothetical protein